MASRLHCTTLANLWTRRTYCTFQKSPVAAPRTAKLWKAAAFTVLVGGVSYSISAVHGEQARSRWVKKYWSYRQGKDIRTKVKKWWFGMTAASRFSLTVIGLNSAVFLMWRLRPLNSLMEKYFISSTTNRSMIPLLLSSFSHQLPWHIGINMVVLWSFAPELLHILGDTVSAHRTWPFFITAGAFASSIGYYFRRMKGLNIGSLGASGALLSVITLVVLNNPDATLYFIILPFIPVPAPMALLGVVSMDIAGLIKGWQLLDHAGHLGGVLFAILYQWWLSDAITRVQPKVVRVWRRWERRWERRRGKKE